MLRHFDVWELEPDVSIFYGVQIDAFRGCVVVIGNGFLPSNNKVAFPWNRDSDGFPERVAVDDQARF